MSEASKRLLDDIANPECVITHYLRRSINDVLDELDGRWQPIATAPKSGQFLIWASGLPWPAHGQIDGVYSNAHGKVNMPNEPFSITATHWMKLPEPPTCNRLL